MPVKAQVRRRRDVYGPPRLGGLNVPMAYVKVLQCFYTMQIPFPEVWLGFSNASRAQTVKQFENIGRVSGGQEEGSEKPVWTVARTSFWLLIQMWIRGIICVS